MKHLEKQQKELEICEKALAEYMESKRRAFPRFYFVSSADLLDILSNGNNPIKVMQHMNKCFQVSCPQHHLLVCSEQDWLSAACTVPKVQPFQLGTPLQHVGMAAAQKIPAELTESMLPNNDCCHSLL